MEEAPQQINNAPNFNPPPIRPLNTGLRKTFTFKFLVVLGGVMILGGSLYAYSSYLAKKNFDLVVQEAQKAQQEMLALEKKRKLNMVQVGSDGILVKIFNHGGECISEAACQSTRLIRADGGISIDGNKTGNLTESELSILKDELRLIDYNRLGAIPFTGTCPMAYDGQEVVYTFYPQGIERSYASCKVVLDENLPIFKLLNQFLLKYKK